MEHRFKEPNRDQMVLRPTDFDDMLEDDHPARAVWEFVSRLQMGEMEEKYAAYEGKAGRTPFSPRLLLALWLYAYTDGVFSCRRLEEHCVKDLAYIWLCGGIEPNYHTLSDFRSAHTEEFNGLFTKALAIMSQAGLIDLDEIFQDGSKVQANASLESGRDKRGLEKLREKAREVVERLDGMSEAKKMELGKKKASARQRAARERLERLEKAMEEYPEREERRKKKGLDPSRTQISVTDPECQKMKHRDGSYKESYNAQAAIDGLEGVIVGVSVSNSSADAHQLTGMVEDVEKRLGGEPKNWVNDAGYHNGANAVEMDKRGTQWWCPSKDYVARVRGHESSEFDKSEFRYDEKEDSYICPGGKRLGKSNKMKMGGRAGVRYVCKECDGCEHKPRCSPDSKGGRNIFRGDDEPQIKRLAEQMATEKAKGLLKKRKTISEGGFAQIKEVLGWRRFRLRGSKKAVCELRLVAMAQNVGIWIKKCFLKVMPAPA